MHSLPAPPSSLLVFGFIALPALLCAFWVWATGAAAEPADRRWRARFWASLALGFWLALTGMLAARPELHDFTSFPPPVMRLFVVGMVLTVVLGLSPVGRRLARLPMALLVGFQAFRIAVELLLHEAWKEGLMPVQMSYFGRNFDVFSGITGLALGLYLLRRPVPRWLLAVWNVMALGLLINVVAIAVLSFPTPYRLFHNDPANVWVTFFPFVWLPTVLVTSALLGHVLVFRRLTLMGRSRSPVIG